MSLGQELGIVKPVNRNTDTCYTWLPWSWKAGSWHAYVLLHPPWPQNFKHCEQHLSLPGSQASFPTSSIPAARSNFFSVTCLIRFLLVNQPFGTLPDAAICYSPEALLNHLVSANTVRLEGWSQAPPGWWTWPGDAEGRLGHCSHLSSHFWRITNLLWQPSHLVRLNSKRFELHLLLHSWMFHLLYPVGWLVGVEVGWLAGTLSFLSFFFFL